jgi:hypothetical protein
MVPAMSEIGIDIVDVRILRTDLTDRGFGDRPMSA